MSELHAPRVSRLDSVRITTHSSRRPSPQPYFQLTTLLPVSVRLLYIHASSTRLSIDMRCVAPDETRQCLLCLRGGGVPAGYTSCDHGSSRHVSAALAFGFSRARRVPKPTIFFLLCVHLNEQPN